MLPVRGRRFFHLLCVVGLYGSRFPQMSSRDLMALAVHHRDLAAVLPKDYDPAVEGAKTPSKLRKVVAEGQHAAATGEIGRAHV